MNRLTRIAPVLLLLLTCALFTAEARADTFVVTSGSATATTQGGVFSFNGLGMSAAGRLTWGAHPNIFDPGQTLNLLTRNFGTDIRPGPATVNGTSYAELHYGGRIDFNIVLPPLDWREGTFSVVVPFTLTGTLRGCPTGNELQGPCTGGLAFDTLLAGHGLATLSLYGIPAGRRGIGISSITYNFADPVPEPATLVLLSTGLAGAAAAARRRRRKV